jgi:hypothetical protein
MPAWATLALQKTQGIYLRDPEDFRNAEEGPVRNGAKRDGTRDEKEHGMSCLIIETD